MEAETRPKGEGFFQTVPTILKLLDPEFVSSFLVKHSGITMQSLEAVAVFDPDSPLQLLCFALRCNQHLRLPECLVDKELMGLTLVKLMECGGNRLKKLDDKKMLGGGRGGINWSKVGAYSFDFNENGLAQSVTHTPTNESAPVPSIVLFTSCGI